jgi:hypothetical protein
MQESKYYNWFDQRVARQQLCKYGPTRNNRWGCVFYVVRATPSAANGQINSQSDSVTCFLCGLHHATVEGLCFLCVVRAERVENTGIGIDFTWLPKFQGNNLVVEEELEVGLWRLNVWLDDFIYV